MLKTINLSTIEFNLYAFEKVEVGTWWNFKNHISRFARLFIVDDGEQFVSFKGKEYHQTPGNIYLVPPFTPVDYLCKSHCIQYYFIFTAEFSDGSDLFSLYSFPGEAIDHPVNGPLCQFLEERLPNFGLSNYNAYDEDFKRAIFSDNSLKLDCEQQMAAEGVLCLLMSSFFKQATRDCDSQRFMRVLNFIENNIEQSLSLKTLAKIESLDPTYFSDLFKKTIGIRPSRYVCARRLIRARQLLISSSFSVKEVAAQVGFTDYDYFFRVFKKEVGVTPRKYRQREQKQIKT